MTSADLFGKAAPILQRMNIGAKCAYKRWTQNSLAPF